MKKIIAMFLCLGTLLLLGTSTSKATNGFAPVEKEDDLVTIESLQDLSWKDIRNGYRKLFSNEDDLCLREIISYIDRNKDFDIQNQSLVYHNGMASLKNTDYETMCKKLRIIIDAYNADNDIQIKAYTKLYPNKPSCMSIDILSSNYPASYVGQLVKIKNGTIFYESSRNFGNGNSNTTFYIDYVGCGFARNPDIPEDYKVFINGISFLDSDGNISSSFYKTFDQMKTLKIRIPIDRSETYMLHICTSKKDLGWVVPEAVQAIN